MNRSNTITQVRRAKLSPEYVDRMLEVLGSQEAKQALESNDVSALSPAVDLFTTDMLMLLSLRWIRGIEVERVRYWKDYSLPLRVLRRVQWGLSPSFFGRPSVFDWCLGRRRVPSERYITSLLDHFKTFTADDDLALLLYISLEGAVHPVNRSDMVTEKKMPFPDYVEVTFKVSLGRPALQVSQGSLLDDLLS